MDSYSLHVESFREVHRARGPSSFWKPTLIVHFGALEMNIITPAGNLHHQAEVGGNVSQHEKLQNSHEQGVSVASKAFA